MEHNVGIAHVTLELEQDEIIGCQLDGWEHYGNVLATLGAAHLLFDATNDLLERVGVHFHLLYSTTKAGGKEYFLHNSPITSVTCKTVKPTPSFHSPSFRLLLLQECSL